MAHWKGTMACQGDLPHTQIPQGDPFGTPPDSQLDFGAEQGMDAAGDNSERHTTFTTSRQECSSVIECMKSAQSVNMKGDGLHH